MSKPSASAVTAGSMQDLVLSAIEANPGGLRTIEVRAIVGSHIQTDDVKRLSALVRGALFLLAKRGLVRVSGEAWVRTYYPTGNAVERLPGRPAARADFKGSAAEWPLGASVLVHLGATDANPGEGTIAKVTRHVVTLTDGSRWSTADGSLLQEDNNDAHITRKS